MEGSTGPPQKVPSQHQRPAIHSPLSNPRLEVTGTSQGQGTSIPVGGPSGRPCPPQEHRGHTLVWTILGRGTVSCPQAIQPAATTQGGREVGGRRDCQEPGQHPDFLT